MGVERGEVAVDEGGAELVFGELARALFVDGFEEGEEGGVGGGLGGGGGAGWGGGAAGLDVEVVALIGVVGG